MVKILCEPVRLIQLLKQSLGYSAGKSTINDTSLIKFTPDSADINCQLSSDCIIVAKYNKSYFIELETENEEPFMAASSLVKDRLSHGFKGEKAEFKTDNEFVHVIGQGDDDKVKEKLTEVDLTRKATVNGKPVHVTLTPLGLLPYTDPTEKEMMPFNLQALVDTAKFGDLPEYEHVQFIFDGKTLIANFPDQMGDRTRPLPIKKWAIKNEIIEGLDMGKPKGEPITIMFNMKLLQQLVAQYETEVWLNINGGMIVFSNTNKDYSLTYIGALIA